MCLMNEVKQLPNKALQINILFSLLISHIPIGNSIASVNSWDGQSKWQGKASMFACIISSMSYDSVFSIALSLQTTMHNLQP